MGFFNRLGLEISLSVRHKLLLRLRQHSQEEKVQLDAGRKIKEVEENIKCKAAIFKRRRVI